MPMRAATVVQQLCKSCRTCFMSYCTFYFTCDRSLSWRRAGKGAFRLHPSARQELEWKWKRRRSPKSVDGPGVELSKYMKLAQHATVSLLWRRATRRVPWVHAACRRVTSHTWSSGQSTLTTDGPRDDDVIIVATATGRWNMAADT